MIVSFAPGSANVGITPTRVVPPSAADVESDRPGAHRSTARQRLHSKASAGIRGRRPVLTEAALRNGSHREERTMGGSGSALHTVVEETSRGKP